MLGAPRGAALQQIERLFGTGTVAGLSDAQLLERYLTRHDVPAFEALVARHGPMVRTVCRGILRDEHAAEDAFQATFLILARKAGAIRGRAALACWLHRVAHRVALVAGAEARRRRTREQEAGWVRMRMKHADGPRDDERAALHQEIARLPQRYRLPVVLCYLEGRTHAEAADELHCGEATVRRRLAGARESLRRRLQRRGLAPSAALVAAALAGETQAAVPAAWTGAAGAAFPARSATTLAGTVLRTLILARLQLIAITALAAGMIAALAAGVIVPDRNESDDTTVKAKSNPPSLTAAPAPEAVDQLVYSGRVLDPNGRPIKGAELSLSSEPIWSENSGRAKVRAASGDDGRFGFTVPRSQFTRDYTDEPWNEVGVVAKLPGYGLGIEQSDRGDGPLALQLVHDLPIQGRILDLQGRPLAGITIRPRTLEGTVRGALDPLLVYYTDRKAAIENPVPDRLWSSIGNQVAPALTGPDGRFRLAGLGRERLVGVIIEGPGIETVWVRIMTRRAATIRAREPGGRVATLYGAEFDHVAAPSHPIVGVVRDADTGARLPGVEIEGHQPDGYINYVKGVTDQSGRYRIEGLAADRKAHLSTVAPKGQPCLRAAREVDNPLAPQPTEVAFALKRGVWLAGRVVDGATGLPVRAQIHYFVFNDNPHLTSVPNFSKDSWTELKYTAPDGTYRVVGLPGRGILAVQAHARADYCLGLGAEKIAGADASGWFHTRPQLCIGVNYNALAEVNPAPDATEVTCDLVLDPGRSVKVTVLDPEGNPLAGAIALGCKDATFDWPLVPLNSAEFTVVRLGPEETRKLIILHDARKLSAGLVVRGNGPAPGTDPVSVRLQPWGVVTGRLVDDLGEPVSGVEIHGMDRPRFDPVDGGVTPAVPVGEDGRFRIEGLVSGRPYTFRVVRRHYGLGVVVENLSVASGETRELGDVRAKSE